MNIHDIRLLFGYNEWATRRILAAAERVPPELYGTAALGYARLRETLVHTMGAERLWLTRWQGGAPAGLPSPDDFPTLAALRARWDADRRDLAAFLDALTDDDLNRTFDYRLLSGKPNSSVLWHTMVHLVNHGTQHRAELAMLLTELGCSPGDIDLVFYTRELDQAGA